MYPLNQLQLTLTQAAYKVSTAGKHQVNVLAGGKSVAGEPLCA